MSKRRKTNKRAKDPLPSTAPEPVPGLSGSFWSSIAQDHVRQIDGAMLSSGNRAQLIDQLTLEVDDLREIFQTILQRRNACAPISCLQPEIMSRIFVFATHISSPRILPNAGLDHDRRPAFTCDLGWIQQTTHVCRRWRDIALNMPKLWADNVCALPGFERMFLHRARNVPLSLQMDTSVPYESAHCNRYNFIIDHLVRAREVDIDDILGHKIPELKKALASTSMPALEAIAYKADLMDKPIPFDLPPMSAPRLQRVTLHNCFIPWNATTLTELSLHNHDNTYLAWNGSRKLDYKLPSFIQLVELLRVSHNLQRLHLCHWIPETSPKPSFLAELPHLTHISLVNRPRRCADLMEHIQPSPFAQIYLDLEAWNDNDIHKDDLDYVDGTAYVEESCRMLKSLASRMNFFAVGHPHLPIAMSVHGGRLWEKGLLVQVFSSAEPSHVNASYKKNPFRRGHELVHSMKFRNLYTEDDEFVALWRILAFDFGLGNVERLAVGDADHDCYLQETYRQIFQLQPKTRVIYFQDCTMYDSNAMLCAPPSTNTSSFLPALETLAFSRLYYPTPPKPKARKGWLPDAWDNLASALEARAAVGLPLQTIEYSSFTSDKLEHTRFWDDAEDSDLPQHFRSVFNRFKDRLNAVLQDRIHDPPADYDTDTDAWDGDGDEDKS